MRADRRDQCDAAEAADGSAQLGSGARLEPPRLDRGQVLRPRLLGVLAQRWDRRATLVVAGAGFGKSTLLAQALAENALAPRGIDLWLSLTVADRDAATLLHALAGVLTPLPEPAEPTIDAVVSRLSSLPPGTCLVLDDLHEVEPGSTGHAVLQHLVEALPLQCSLLLGSRTDPALPFADWSAKGLVETLTERDLAYDAAELAVLAGAKGRDASELAGFGGWPALVELSLAVGRDGSESYLRQVVLGRLPLREQRWLGALHAIGGGDLELVTAALGDPLDMVDRPLRSAFAGLGSVPAMQVLAGGGFRPHALWHDTLDELNDRSERDAMQRRAAAELLRRGDHDGAIRLYRRCGDTDGMCSVVVDSCTSGTWRYPVQTLERWRELLPAEAAGRPEERLLAALTGREGATFDDATVAAVADAATAFRERGDVGAEVAALAELAFVSREQGNTEAFGVVAVRLFELLAEGRSEVTGFVALLHATLAEAADDDEATLAALAEPEDLPLSRQWRSRAHWLRAHSTVMLGRPADAVVDAELSRSVAEDEFLGARYLMAYVRWWIGADSASIAALPFIGDEPYRTPFDCVYGGGVFAALHAFAGDLEVAERSLAIAVEAAGAQGADGMFARPEYVGILRCSQAAIEAARGDDAAAAATLRSFFSEHPTSSPIGRRVARRVPALVEALVPDERDALAAAPFGPAHAEARAIGDWFVALRAGQHALPPAGWRDRLLNALPLRWAVEAAARTVSVDDAAAVAVVDRLVDLRPSSVRSVLRELADRADGDDVAEGARRLLGVVPIRPDDPVRLTLFGPMSVDHGTAVAPVDGALRADARTVLALLAAAGPDTVDHLGALLWPTFEPAQARERLDAAVDVACDVLEPRRSAGDAPFLLRREGDSLALAPAPWLETDLRVFESAIVDASEAHRTGAHSAELGLLEHALAHVVGPPLPDLVACESAAALVDSVVARVVRAGQRAAALRFARGDHATARRHAATVLAVDPSNEASHQITVASYADEGRTAAALEAFAAWQRSRAELGLGRSPEMAMLARRLGLPDDHAPAIDAAGDEATATIGVQVLGRFAATIGDHEAAVAGGKPQELVKLLAVAGRPMPEDEVCEALWPDVDPEIGRRRLRNVVARVRAAGPFVERGEGLLAIADVVTVDVRRFEVMARDALRRGAGDLDAVLADYGGELLPADRFVEWTTAPRERIRALVVELLECAIEHAVAAGETAAAVGAIDRLLDVDPFAEHWAAQAASLLRGAGQAAAAARWDERAARLRSELGL